MNKIFQFLSVVCTYEIDYLLLQKK